MAHVHLDRESDRDLCPLVLDRLPAIVGHPGHVDEEIVRSEPECPTVASLAFREQVQRRADAERREYMCRNLEVEVASDVPSVLVTGQVNLAAHYHGHELVGRGEPLLLDAGCVVRILVARIGAQDSGTRTLKITKGGPTPGIE